MKASYYRRKWEGIKNSTVTPDELRMLSRQIACSYLDQYLQTCSHDSGLIDLLCEMTTFSDDPELAAPGTQALFNIIIEGLCDDFEELQTDTYNMVMAQIISYCRGIPAGRDLDLSLKEFNIHSYDDLLERIRYIRLSSRPLPERTKIKKIVLLSRVTIGADIAITSVILQRLKKIFPSAGIVILGSSKLREVYGGDPEITIREVPYARRGDLLERLSVWHSVLNIITGETGAFSADETILVDPDSRLSQLGVLPLVPAENYYFFDSRSAVPFNSRMSMVELTNSWMDSLGSEQDFCYPKVWLRTPDIGKASAFCSSLRKSGAKKIIAVNFGVGGNRRKKLGSGLEGKLLMSLLKEPDTVILLDKGFGDEEVSHINSLIDSVQEQGRRAEHADLASSRGHEISHGLIGIQSSIGEMAALIASCDEFIGYDSACQHIAAASGTPCVTIFAGSNNMRFVRRWSAHGRGECGIVHVDTLNDPALIDVDNIISRVMVLRETHKGAAGQ